MGWLGICVSWHGVYGPYICGTLPWQPCPYMEQQLYLILPVPLTGVDTGRRSFLNGFSNMPTLGGLAVTDTCGAFPASGRTVLPQALPYAQAALASPAPSLRLLGVRQLSNLVLSGEPADDSDSVQLVLLLVGMLEVSIRTCQHS
jgi:hypothetical protein